MVRLRGMAAAACLTLLVLACASGGEPVPGGVRVPVLAGRPMTACVVTSEVPVKAELRGFCGTLDVLEDRASPAGRRIPLNVVVVPAEAATPAPDAFVALAGGPGDASTTFFAWLPAVYTGVHATHDIVLVDQRGTGGSNAMTLPAVPDTAGLSAAEADARMAAWAADGLAKLPGDPRFYTSSIAADDLDAVREALGYASVDLYGASYGGELAQYYLRQHGDRVRVAILDGTTPLDVPVLERMAASSEGALELLLARCDRDAACHAAFPTLEADWAVTRDGLAAGLVTGISDPTTGSPGVATLAMVGPSIHAALLTGATAMQLPLAIEMTHQERWAEIPQLGSQASGTGPSLAMADIILCSEPWARFDRSEVERIGADSYLLPSQLAEADARAARCAHLPQGVITAGEANPVLTSAPVLWLVGDGDPQDPPSNLAAVTGQQPNAKVVVMPAQEHVVGHLGCGPQVIAAFVDAGTASGLDTACIADGPSPAPTFRLH